MERIADALKVSPRTVQRHRRSAGIAKPFRRVPEADFAVAQQMLDDGASYEEAARTVGCSAHAIAGRFPGRGWTQLEVARFAGYMSRMKRAGKA